MNDQQYVTIVSPGVLAPVTPTLSTKKRRTFCQKALSVMKRAIGTRETQLSTDSDDCQSFPIGIPLSECSSVADLDFYIAKHAVPLVKPEPEPAPSVEDEEVFDKTQPNDEQPQNIEQIPLKTDKANYILRTRGANANAPLDCDEYDVDDDFIMINNEAKPSEPNALQLLIEYLHRTTQRDTSERVLIEAAEALARCCIENLINSASIDISSIRPIAVHFAATLGIYGEDDVCDMDLGATGTIIPIAPANITITNPSKWIDSVFAFMNDRERQNFQTKLIREYCASAIKHLNYEHSSQTLNTLHCAVTLNTIRTTLPLVHEKLCNCIKLTCCCQCYDLVSFTGCSACYHNTCGNFCDQQPCATNRNVYPDAVVTYANNKVSTDFIFLNYFARIYVLYSYIKSILP